MSCYSLQLDTVRVGSDSISLPPIIKKNLTDVVRTALKSIDFQGGDLGVSLGAEGINLFAGGQTHSIVTRSACNVARRLKAYARHQKAPLAPTYIEAGPSQTVVDGLYKGAPKGLRGRIATAVDVVSNVSTTAQKAQQIDALLHGKGVVVSQAGKILGLFNGAIWLGLGVSDLYTGAQDLQSAREIDDQEGALRAKARIWSARSVWVGAAFDVGTRITNLASSAPVVQTVSQSLEIVATNFFGWSSLIGIAMALLSFFRCYQFRNRLLIDYLDGGGALARSDNQKIQAAVKYLQDQVAIAPEDREKIRSEILQAGKVSQDSVDQELDRRVSQLAQKKIAYFKRRASLKAARLVLAASKPGTTLTLEQAKTLIQEVLKQGEKKMILNAVTVLAAIIGLMAFGLGSFANLQTVAMILYGTSTGIYAIIGAIGLFSALVWRDNEAPVNGFPALEYVPLVLS